MNAVVANLDELHGQMVTVVGVLTLDFEGDSLWHVPKAERQDGTPFPSSLWIELAAEGTSLTWADLQRHDRRQVVVSALVDAQTPGHMGLWSGTLRVVDVVRLKRWAALF